MTEFRYSICEPLNPKVIEKGMIAPDSVIGLFNDFQWDYYLKQIEVAETRKMDIYFSPRWKWRIKRIKTGLRSLLSAIRKILSFIFLQTSHKRGEEAVFRKPQTVVEDYVSEITGQTKEDVIECLNALIKNDQEFLRRKIA